MRYNLNYMHFNIMLVISLCLIVFDKDNFPKYFS